MRHPGRFADRVAYYSSEFFSNPADDMWERLQYPDAGPDADPDAVLNDHADCVTLTNATGDLWELLQHPEWESAHWRQLRHTEPGQSGHRRLGWSTYPRPRLADTRLAQQRAHDARMVLASGSPYACRVA